jgi:hypothetical protein
MISSPQPLLYRTPFVDLSIAVFQQYVNQQKCINSCSFVQFVDRKIFCICITSVLLCVPCGKNNLRYLTAKILFFMELHGKNSPCLRRTGYIIPPEVFCIIRGFVATLILQYCRWECNKKALSAKIADRA